MTANITQHITMHDMTTKEYCKMFNLTCAKPQKYRDAFSGSKNPGYQHGGTMSPFSKNNPNYDPEWYANFTAYMKEWRKNNKDTSKFHIEYWLKVADGDEVLAKALYSKFQTRDLAYFVDKYGEEEGLIRWTGKIEKWTKNFKKVNFSKISQELFNAVAQQLPSEIHETLYYATYDRPEMANNLNKEYRLKVGPTFIRPDFICLESKRIIEFDGTYWHSRDVVSAEKEELRDKRIHDSGYAVLHIAESDFIKNRQEMIDLCVFYMTMSEESLQEFVTQMNG
jgi:very-short-patch-repair endonuclease